MNKLQLNVNGKNLKVGDTLTLSSIFKNIPVRINTLYENNEVVFEDNDKNLYRINIECLNKFTNAKIIKNESSCISWEKNNISYKLEIFPTCIKVLITHEDKTSKFFTLLCDYLQSPDDRCIKSDKSSIISVEYDTLTIKVQHNYDLTDSNTLQKFTQTNTASISFNDIYLLCAVFNKIVIGREK